MRVVVRRYEAGGAEESANRSVQIVDFFIEGFHLNLITLHSLYMTRYCLVPLGYHGMFTYTGF